MGLGRPVTLLDQARVCSTKRQGSADVNAQGLLALTAALVAAANGVRIEPDPHPSLEPWAAQGQALWHQRMGQLNLSCAQCHDQRAGQRLGGTRIPQGHDTGYPLYRMEWQTVGPLQRRLRGCMTGIRAEPFAPDADEWLALMVYMQRRSKGLALEAGAVRP
jgi:sulfur-oxidizing protein SoxA